MSDAPQVKKLLEAFGLESLLEIVDEQALGQIEAEIAELGGVDNVMSDKLPPPPPPRANPAFGTPDAPITASTTRYRCREQHAPEVHGGHILDVGPLEITTRRDTLDGELVWRIDMRRVDNGMSFHHNVIVRAADHRLMRHEAGTPMRVFTGFVAGDWAHLSVKGELGKSARDRLPEAAFASLWSLWTALAAAPLGAGWTTSASLYVKVSTYDWRFIPIRLEVSGEERVTVPAGTFDCWIVTAQGAGDTRRVEDRYWVSRGENVTRAVVRAHEQRHAGTTRFYELASVDRLTVSAETTAPEGPADPPPAVPTPERAATSRARMDKVDQLLNEIPEASDPLIRNLLKVYAFEGRTDMFAGLLESLGAGSADVGEGNAQASVTEPSRAEVPEDRVHAAAEQVPPNVIAGPSASLELTVPDARMTLDSLPLRPSPWVIPREEIEKRVDESVRRIPSLAELQDSDNVRGVPHEALTRYDRERREYGEDVRAMWELHNLWSDYLSRRVTVSAAVTVDSGEARPTRVRVTVPQGIGIELPHEELGIDKAVPPLPMKAPLDQHRKRLVRRLLAVRTHDQGQVPVDRYSMPDGSTVLVVGPVLASRSAVMMFRFAITFASWDSVKPFTLTYDIAPEGMPAVSGSVHVGTHAAT